MHTDPTKFLESIAGPLGWFYLTACASNGLAAVAAWRKGAHGSRPVAWALLGAAFGILARQAFQGRPLLMPETLKDTIDEALGPVTFTLGSFATLLLLYRARRFFVRPAVAWSIFNASLLLMGASMTDPDFAAIVTRPDNVPIVAMVYLLGFFTWLAGYQAVENDRRLDEGSAPVEKQYEEKVLVWPDLVYIELICMILVTVVLLVWSLAIKAPLEQPANPVVTPNPSKAPWYFLGLQELLVFSDAWNVGVVVPCLIILGLMAIPYLDCNREGDGYYTIDRRRFAYLVFQFGFLQLWVLLILIGTFMRGPNWNFFGPYEVQDPHKVLALTNVKLSELFWAILLGQSVPQVPGGAGRLAELAHILWREIAGVVFLAIYFVALPPLLARTILRDLRRKMGLGRYTIMILLLLMMMTIPLKMILRWALNVSYVVSIPEYSLNF